MKKKDRVKSNILFNEIINSGNRLSNKYFLVCIKESNDLNNKYGIAVGKKIGKAVLRNKIKRQIRNIIDNNKDLFPNYHNYIIICKKEILNLSFKDINDKLIDLINKGAKNEK